MFLGVDSDFDKNFQKFRSLFLEKFKNFELKLYSSLHKQVINDQGIPSLNKRQYIIPGFNKILTDGERELYEFVDK
jgi:hypothetical protein